jgi:hypothetical protein
VWALRETGGRVLIGSLAGETRDGQVIDLSLPTPLTDVVGLQVGTLESPSWVGWREVEAFEGDGPPACLATLTGEATLRARPAVRSPSLGPLAAGDLALVAARVSGENTDWLAVPGIGFVRADLVTLEGACDDLPAEAPTVRATVPVTFFVRSLEAVNGPYYLAGEFGSAYPIWDPAGLEMISPLSSLAWAIRLELPPGATIQYKYTLGSWETVEKDANCEEVPNRTLTVGDEPMTVRDVVEAWRGVGVCDS